jgi:DNA processing protein
LNHPVDWLTLALIPGLGPRAVLALATRGLLREAIRRPEPHADILGGAAVARLRSGAARQVAEAELRRAEQMGVTVVCLDAADYPPLLREIYDPPPALFVRGRLSEPDTETSLAIAIVGTRSASPQGRSLARSLARELAGGGATIVSGLARGIDAAAHEGALEAGGRTLAVLGSGVDRVYPPEHELLATRVAERGAVLSELPLGSAPLAFNFPRRNRIIAGLARAVVVVEAPKRSGALVTARLALDGGRDVFAVPGHPSAPGAVGTNALIRDGAVLVRDAEDVASELGLSLKPCREAPATDEILRALEGGVPRTLDEIADRSGQPAAELLSRLTALELADRVRRLPGALFVRS